MSGADQSSLISFLAASVLVVDPDGHIIYANPAFQRRFCGDERPLQGESLASIFAGGGREAILGAVAQVCVSGGEAHFRLLEGGRGYLAVASPIESEGSRVGVMVLLTDEPKSDGRLLTLHGQIQEPLDEVRSILEELFEQTGGRRSEIYRNLVERGIMALERVCKWNDEFRGVLTGRSRSDDDVALDPVRAVREVVGIVAPEFEDASIELELLAPAQLPAVRGDTEILESALMWLLRSRLADAQPGGGVALTARALGESKVKGVVLSVIDSPPASISLEEAVQFDSGAVHEAVAALGGSIYTAVEPAIGRVTALRLAVAPVALPRNV